MSELKLDINEIKELIDKFSKSNLGELKIKDGDFEFKLEAKEEPQVTFVNDSSAKASQPIVQVAQQTVAAPASEKKEEAIEGNVMKSPIVGTYYASASPDKPPFVTVGQKVKKGDVICIIESMKLMNEIQSDFDGEIAEILVSNAEGVEFNQPIMIIKQ